METRPAPFENAQELSQLGFPNLEGVWTNCFDTDRMREFMSPHYLSMQSAEQQATTIDNSGYYAGLLREVIQRPLFRKDPSAALQILELGAGSGGGSIAALEIFPRGHLTVSDFSVSMLAVTKIALSQRGQLERCTLCQIDAENLTFPAGQFDMIFGAAMLHHLFDPEKALHSCYRVLKEDGVAVFFEPFEPGMKIVSLIYQMALRDPRSYLKHPRFRKYLQSSVETWQKMSERPTPRAFFEGRDDKVFFTSHEFRQMAKKIGFREVDIFTLSRSAHPFKDLVQGHLTGNNFHRIPKWFWGIVEEVERSLSANAKQDLFTEGAIIFAK